MNRHFLRLVSAAAAAVLFVACGDDTAGPGTPAEVTVRAYVDADGSGAFNAGDVPIQSAEVVLVSTGNTGTQSATTNAEGLATFASVRPGSYTIQFAGTQPTGAVLATAATPLVVVPFQGGEFTTEFRFVFNPGVLEGILFRDDNQSGAFEAGADTPAPGLEVLLYRGATAEGEPIDTATTDEGGAYRFTGLRPGTYTVVVVALPTMQIVGGNAQVVEVGPAGATPMSIVFTGNLISTIAEARALQAQRDSAEVAVEGVVTVGTGPFGNSLFYIQDPTAGVQVFLATAPADPNALQVGDSVRVIGRITKFREELNITRAAVEELGAGTVPAPRPVTVDDINAGDFEGELAVVASVTVDSIRTTNAFGSHNVFATDDGGDQVRIFVDNRTGITVADWVVGGTYEVTGILGTTTSGTTIIRQLKPRQLSDIRFATGAITIAEARQRPLGDSVVVQGVVTLGTGPFGSRTFYIQDQTGGIMAFIRAATAPTVNLGDSLRVSGIMNAFSGDLEVDTVSILMLGTGTVPTPRVVTGADIQSRQYEGELVQVLNAEVVSVPGGTGSAFNVVFRDEAGTQFEVRVHGSGVGLTRANFTVGARYDVTGILSVFQPTGGTALPQLKPRSPADLVAR